MSESRVLAPVLAPGVKPKGPASYFPSIEKKYGHPVQHWLDLVVGQLDGHAHMEVVRWLGSEHGITHGHANAIVAFVRAHLDG